MTSAPGHRIGRHPVGDVRRRPPFTWLPGLVGAIGTPGGQGGAVSTSGPRPPAPATPRSGRLHVHRFRRAGDDWFSSASLYACRCGVVRPGL